MIKHKPMDDIMMVYNTVFDLIRAGLDPCAPYGSIPILIWITDQVGHTTGKQVSVVCMYI